MSEPNVIIRIRGTQTYEDREPVVIELTTEGTLRREGEALVMTYAESTLTGLEGTTTAFEIREGSVRLIRTGAVNSTMHFEVGQTDRSLYDTGMGPLLVTTRTRRIEDRLDETGGSLRVDYDIVIENLGTGRIEYDILVTRR